MKYWLYLLLLMATPALAQVRLSPCDKQDYELYASRLKALFNPDASQQYIVVDGQKELYALQVIKGSRLGQRKKTLALKDFKQVYTIDDDSLCQIKVSSLLRFAVFSSTYLVRKRLGFLKTCFLFDMQDGAQCAIRNADVAAGSLIDVLEQVCIAVRKNNPETIRRLFPQIDSLTKHFKSYELEESWAIETAEQDEHNMPSAILSTYYKGFNFQFFQPETDTDSLCRKYGKLLKTVAQWLFLHSNVLDFNERVYVCIHHDRSTIYDRFAHLYGKYYFHIIADELKESTLYALFKSRFLDS